MGHLNLAAEIPINLAYEDDLSLEMLLRILKSPGVLSSEKGFSVGKCFPGRGYGFLKRNISGFNKASKGMPYLILTDLDKKECAPLLIREWLPATANHNLIFRKDIVPKRGSTAKQGPAYNERLISFVRVAWNPSQARRNSPSLERTIMALERFIPKWEAL